MANQDIVHTVNKAIRQLTGEKELYSQGDFNILYIGLLGLDPNDGEYKLVSRGQEEINLHNIQHFFVTKITSTWDPELKALELFKNLDKNGKYFIDREDIVLACEEIGSKLPLDVLLGCFDTIASDGTLDYFNFKNIYLRHLANQSQSTP
ncbi:hypothetical protein HHI36_009509 [Cryptolaemus montrouzieri]|uniref:EF-hand domain-containing protein n=1 Tax=Cryptolaemus montrouzieri TaxID=559131 RepID=A0ABD2MFW5_9CUCU